MVHIPALHRHWGIRIAIQAIFLATLFGVGFSTLFASSASAHSAAQHKVFNATNSYPVLFVHGFNSSAAITGGCNGTWGTAESYLTSHGYTGQFITIGFYQGDQGCNVNLYNRQTSHCNNYFAGNTGTTNEDQRHIACTLDWYIWNNFAQYGHNVQIVTHSMGGTIVRWAVYAANTGNSSLPPHIYVQDIVTMAAPHNGIPWGASLVCGICLQLAELQPGSSFLKGLQNNAQNPQAANGTTWTIFGSSCESWTNGGIADSSEMAMAATHKVLYLNPPCYHHGDYLFDQSDSLNAYADYCNTACRGLPTNYTTSFSHSLRDMESAITGS